MGLKYNNKYNHWEAERDFLLFCELASELDYDEPDEEEDEDEELKELLDETTSLEEDDDIIY